MRRVLTWLLALLALTNVACVTASPPRYRHSGRTTTSITTTTPTTVASYAPPLPSGTIRIFDLTTTTLDPGITFTRATAATCVGDNGLLKSFPSGTMRTCFDPLTLQPIGALLEEARTNIEQHSQDTTGWTANGSTLTNNYSAADWATAPDGTYTSTFLQENTATSAHSASAPAVALSAVQYAGSIWVRSGDYGGNHSVRYMAIRGGQTTTGHFPWCTLDPATATLACNGDVTSARIVQYNNGNYRVGMTWTTVNTGSFGMVVAASNVATAPANTITTGPSYLGASNWMWYWGAQIEATSTNFPQETSYVPTTTASVTRNADVASVTGSNFSSWFNQSAGTMCATLTGGSSLGIVWEAASDTAGTLAHNLVRTNSGISGPGLRLATGTSNTTTQAQNISPSDDALAGFAYLATPTGYVTTRDCYAYGTNDFQQYRDGAIVGAQDTLGTLPTPTFLYIGHRNGTLQLDGYISQLEYFSTRRTDALLASDSVIPTVEYAGAKPGTSTFSTAGYTAKEFVADYGGVCDGVTNNNTALANALNAPNLTKVHFPTGTCVYTAFQQSSNATNLIFYGDGPDKTVLKNTTVNGNSSLVLFNSTNVSFYDMQFLATNTTARTVTGSDSAFYVYQSPGPILIKNVYARNISGASFLVAQSTNVTLSHDTADHSWSDALHACCTSPNFTITFSKSYEGGGDDSFASIGYSPDNNNLGVINDNLSMDGWWGSCISFEGSTNGQAKRNKCYRSGASGVRLQSLGSPYFTGAVTGITIQDNYLEGVKTRASLTHGAITMIADSQANVTGNTFLSNTIKDPLSVYGFMGITNGFNVTATLTNNVMLNTTGNMTTAYSADAGTTFTKSGNLLNGASAP